MAVIDADALAAGIKDRYPAEKQAEYEAWREQLHPVLQRAVDRAIASAAVDGWRAHPAAFMFHITSDPWWLRPHVQFLSLKYRDAVTGVSNRQQWHLPPRLGKTRVLDGGEIWNLDRTAGRAMSIRASYAKTLATRSSIAVRTGIGHADVNCEVGPPPEGTPGREKSTQSEWYTTAGGGMFATGINATVLGFGVGRGGVLAIDDPMEDWTVAHSESRRKALFEQYRGTFRHRLDDDTAAILVVHQRLNRLDLSGMLNEAAEAGDGDEFEMVVLPMIAEEGDILGREPGEPLDPIAFPIEACRSRAKGQGTYVSAAVEQQNPSEEEGDELLREWFRLEDATPAKYDQQITSWDFKLKNTETGDYVVGQAWGRTGPDFWLFDQVRGQYDHATTANAMALLSVRNPQIRTHLVEAAGSVSEVLPLLRKAQPDYVVTPEMAGRLGMTEDEAEQVQDLRRRGMSGIVTKAPKGDKVVRARSWLVPPAEAGNVHLYSRMPGLAGLLDEWAGFPDHADHDDQVDAASQALQRLQTGTGGIAKAKSKRRVPQTQKPSTGRTGRSTRPTAPKR